MSKTQKCFACIGDWVSLYSRLLWLRPPQRPLSSPSHLEFVAPWFPPHSVHASREGRRGWCHVLGGFPPPGFPPRVPTLCSNQGCSHSPSCGVRTQSLLYSPLQTCSIISLPPARSVSPHHDFRGGSPAWDLSSGFMTATLKARQGVKPFSPLKMLLVPTGKRLQKHFLASCFSFRN